VSSTRPINLDSRRALASFLILIVMLPSSWGCALFTDPVPPGFDTIAIQVEVERDKPGDIEGDLRAFSTLNGVLVGALTGIPTFAVAGGIGGFGVGALLCAPTLLLYPFCVAVAIAIGFVGGAVVGLFGGVTVGIIGGLPSETAKEVTAVLARLEENRTFDEDLIMAMRGAIPEQKQVEEADAAAIVTARLEKFDLRQHSKDQLSLRLWASMLQSWEENPGERPKRKTCEYRYDSEKKGVEIWLADGGIAFREAVTLGIETFARWMNADLEAFASETEFDETEEDPASCFKEDRWYRFF
jgi:hypothetical protein